jgi:hypothetical protein
MVQPIENLDDLRKPFFEAFKAESEKEYDSIVKYKALFLQTKVSETLNNFNNVPDSTVVAENVDEILKF